MKCKTVGLKVIDNDRGHVATQPSDFKELLE